MATKKPTNKTQTHARAREKVSSAAKGPGRKGGKPRAASGGKRSSAPAKKKSPPAALTKEQKRKIEKRRKIAKKKALLAQQKSLEKKKKQKAGHPASVKGRPAKKPLEKAELKKKKDKLKAKDREKGHKKDRKKDREKGLTFPGSWEKLEGYIPPKVEKVAESVLSNYDLKVKEMLAVATKPLKGGVIWQVTTKKRLYSLKLLHRRPERSLFSIWAQEYLVNNKARVPAIVRTEDDRLYVEMGNKLWLVCEWIESLTQAGKDLKGAQAICYGLGEFHRLSRGYQPPEEAEYSSRLNRWPDYFERIVTKFGWFQRLGQAYHDTPAGPELIKAVEVFGEQAREGLNRLRQSPYAGLAARGENYWGLAHQDYGWGNAQLGPGGVWVIDLDGVIFDLPIRDLRKLISSCMKDFDKWNLKWIKGMISAYHKANPIEPELYEVFLIDLAMPNEFYQFIKPMVYDPVTFLNAETRNELKRMLKWEKSKRSVIAALSDWKVG